MTDGSGFSAALPFVPWHMWGGSLPLTGRKKTPAIVSDQYDMTGQVARVSYKRPETWAFWLGCRLVGGDVDAVDRLIRVRFNLAIGIGRSAFQTIQTPYDPGSLAFAVFDFVVLAGVVPGNQLNNVKYTTKVQTPPMQDTALPANPTVYLIDYFVAQDIQCSCDFTIQSGTNGLQVNAEASAYFAPLNHVRPDWFAPQDDKQFRGQETGGT